MKRFYSKFRIALITFALGSASVFMFQGALYSDAASVDLPHTNSGEIIVVFPRYEHEMPKGVGGGAGSGMPEESKP